MKLFIVLFGLLISSCFSCAHFNPTFKNEDPVKQTYSSVGRLSVVSEDGKKAIFATGFAISDSKIMTAGHFCVGWFEGNAKGVFPDKISITIVYGNKLLELNQILSVALIDEKMDICVLEGNPGLRPLKFVDNFNKVETGDKVYTIGSPLSLFPQYSEGRVNVPKFDIGKAQLLFISLRISPGVSGAPVLDKNGQVIGMVVASIVPNVFMLAESPFALAQRSDVLKKFVKMVEEE